jgi:nicotinamidase-related amidase
MSDDGLRFGPLDDTAVHLCVDMQRMFAEETEWHMPWMKRVLPRVVELCRAHPGRAVFTRFIPAERAEDREGTWRQYYERWASMTLDRLDPDLVGLVPELRPFVTPAQTFDKPVYSPWHTGRLDRILKERGITALIISGGETDVCVLATILGAVDLGYRVIVATDALCSSSDEAHDSAIDLYHRRYGSQVEPVETATILEAWH